MRAFDAELYLRLLGERWLASGDLEPGRSAAPVPAAALALVSSGLIATERAEAVARDYGEAAVQRARDPHQARMFQAHGPGQDHEPAREPLAPRRIAGSQVSFTKAGWEITVPWVIFGADTAKLGMHGRPLSSKLHPPQPPAVDVRLPDGTLLGAHVNSWGSSGINGSFPIDGPINADVPWVEVEGQRVSLEAPAREIPVVLEALPAEASPTRYLWQRLADFGDRHGDPGIVPAIDALIAAGVLAPEDPDIAGLGFVGEHINQLRHFMRGRGAVGPTPPPGLPAQWAGVFAGFSGPGAEGTLPIGAATPIFDGMSVAINALTAEADGWMLDVETLGHPHASPFTSPFHRRPLALWAVDDRGNHYLGAMNGWSGGGPDGRGAGRIGFSALDPAASQLTLAPTGSTQRALITVELRWA